MYVEIGVITTSRCETSENRKEMRDRHAHTHTHARPITLA